MSFKQQMVLKVREHKIFYRNSGPTQLKILILFDHLLTYRGHQLYFPEDQNISGQMPCGQTQNIIKIPLLSNIVI